MAAEDKVNLLSGLKPGEERCLQLLVECLQEFNRLDRQHPSEMEEFIGALHRLQDLVAVRAVRRSRPHYWPVYAKVGVKWKKQSTDPNEPVFEALGAELVEDLEEEDED